jgi:hypothetical protein
MRLTEYIEMVEFLVMKNQWNPPKWKGLDKWLAQPIEEAETPTTPTSGST